MILGSRVCLILAYINGFAHLDYLANYLNDLWLFDTQEYKWRQIEFRDADRKPTCVTPPPLEPPHD